MERKSEYNHNLIFLKGLAILHKERREQVNSIAIEPFNSILFHKPEPTDKQNPYHSIRFENIKGI